MQKTQIIYNQKENKTMANWQKEIMKLANDFCLNMEKVKEIVTEVDEITTRNGKESSEYKYNKAYVRIKPMIMSI